jgi:Ser/Thr protein kinase RdoA (MazF antagonist)
MSVATPSDADLRAALESALASVGMESPLELSRQPSRYRTSFPLEEIELTFAGGERRRLAFKRLDWSCLDEEAQLAKPRFLHEPTREPAVYAFLLEPAGLGAPRYFGAAIDAEAGRHWLFVEWVEGRELYQVGELGIWLGVARWLGEMHRTLGPALDGVARELPLLEYDTAHYRRWIERAVEFRAGASGEARERRGIAWLAERYDAVVEAMDSLPRTVIHGELYASNVLVTGEASSLRVAPVDWELAARAPAAIDLAALVSGAWSDGERAELVAAYGAGEGVTPVPARELDFARLHLAVQWLGWAPPAWEPPPAQRHDWFSEALRLAERLEL